MDGAPLGHDSLVGPLTGAPGPTPYVVRQPLLSAQARNRRGLSPAGDEQNSKATFAHPQVPDSGLSSKW